MHHADPIPGFREMRGKEVFPEHTENGRYTRGVTEFIVNIDPDNVGAMLRRKLDYSFPNQRAEVYISDASGSENWQHAGTWYLAGSNTCVYSDPRGELAKRLYVVQTSNRRFRDDEFLIPSKLTKGKSAVRVRIKFTPEERDLYPDYRYPRQTAWSELRYTVYSFVLPDFKQTN